ncbi:hypothetical protein OGAPHI_005640 [Ogataea philodendri]|uniref:Uncharacterized protein n=1 Tax=Ogataea philodendri TaxID=1378263 RepID=A0A9P8T143_9ASCO|nr:uncharacterized protein OGAPHI_005640 [Ogataea philodendri]KAH3662388.1 hypothetical protein OGAPHI_005640 [Ogataea philodendri]
MAVSASLMATAISSTKFTWPGASKMFTTLEVCLKSGINNVILDVLMDSPLLISMVWLSVYLMGLKSLANGVSKLCVSWTNMSRKAVFPE